MIIALLIGGLTECDQPANKTGGLDTPINNDLFEINIDKKPVIDASLPIVIDGNNMIHAYLNNKKLPISKFYYALDQLSSLLPAKTPKHIVIKTSEKSNLYDLITVSKQHPTIYYHMAKTIKRQTDTKPHVYKACDDLLTIWLRKELNAYIVSNDLYRDFKYMNNVPPFAHYEIKNGIVVKHIVDPKKMHADIIYFDKPNNYNHVLFELIGNDNNNNNNSSYLIMKIKV